MGDFSSREAARGGFYASSSGTSRSWPFPAPYAATHGALRLSHYPLGLVLYDGQESRILVGELRN
jgi:hypothetical protein